MADNVFHCEHRVTYADCTVGNHVYYSRYLDLLEMARGEFFRHLGKTLLQWQAEDTTFPVLECRIEYHAPARYDDVLTIEVRPTMAKGVRVNFGQRILRGSQLLVEAETFHACAGLNERPKRLPQELVDMLASYLPPSGSVGRKDVNPAL